ncbi:MAG: hypothetical protein C5B59_18300 [Bacteroidetes bacterium]|nr:MAG: hypothetical protein C5B59_18300 [Bacteroidota bacterium]
MKRQYGISVSKIICHLLFTIVFWIFPAVTFAASSIPIFGPTAPFNHQIPAGATYTVETRIGSFRQVYTDYSIPLYRIFPPLPALVTVTNTYSGRTAQWPIPTTAQPATGDDHHLGVISTSENELYEMWDAVWAGTTQINAGGMKDFPLNGTGISNPTYQKVTAAGFAVSAGAVLREDFTDPATGQLNPTLSINHALAAAIPNALIQNNGFVAPAVGGESGDTGDIPLGALYAIPKSVNVDALQIHPLSKALLRAARDYGIYINDSNAAAQYNNKDTATIRIEPGLTDSLFGQASDDLIPTVQQDIYTVVAQYGLYRVTGVDFSYVNQPVPTGSPVSPTATLPVQPTVTVRPTATPIPSVVPTIPNPTILIATPTPPHPTQISTCTDPAIPAVGAWFCQIPTNLKNFLEQLYLLVYYFNRTSNMAYLLNGIYPVSTPTPTTATGVTPTPTTAAALPNPPSWWYAQPDNLRNFLDQLYLLVDYFNRASTMAYLLVGIYPPATPIPTLPPGVTPSVTVTPVPSGNTTITLVPTADTYARMTAPTTIDGTNTIVKVSGPTNTGDITFITYDLTALAGKTISSALFSFYITNASVGTDSVYAVADSSWTEATLNYNNMPALGSLSTTFNSNNLMNGWYQVDLTSLMQANAGKVVTFAISSQDTDALWFNSRESTNPETLQIRYQ